MSLVGVSIGVFAGPARTAAQQMIRQAALAAHTPIFMQESGHGHPEPC